MNAKELKQLLETIPEESTIILGFNNHYMLLSDVVDASTPITGNKHGALVLYPDTKEIELEGGHCDTCGTMQIYIDGLCCACSSEYVK